LKRFEILADSPLIGHPIKLKNPRLANIRFFPVTRYRSYLIFYRPITDGIQVLHVYHGARNTRALLEAEGLDIT
jgi:toxin ParE1/3/4